MYAECASVVGIHKLIVNRIKVETEKYHKEWFSSDYKVHRLYVLSVLVKCKLYNSVKWLSNDLRDKSIIGIAKRKRKQPDVGHNKLSKKLSKLQNV